MSSKILADQSAIILSFGLRPEHQKPKKKLSSMKGLTVFYNSPFPRLDLCWKHSSVTKGTDYCHLRPQVWAQGQAHPEVAALTVT